MAKITCVRVGWICTSGMILGLFGLIGYLSFLINRCNDYGYCESVHEYSARYTNYTITNSTSGPIIQYTFMALRDSRPFQEYICDQERITDMSRINRYIMKYIATETYTIYVKPGDVCTMKKPISTVYLLGSGIGTIILVLICCAVCCTMCLGEDKQHTYNMNIAHNPPVAYLAPVVVTVAPTPPLPNCHICMDRQIGIVFAGCGHTICTQCATKLTICPMCRQQSAKIPLRT